MENKFIPDAIELVSKAIEADKNEDYEKALALYRDSLGRFTMGLKYEKNEARKKLIIERVEGYMKRAEELRDYLSKRSKLFLGFGTDTNSTKLSILGEWTSLPHMQTKRSHCAAVSVGEQIYVVGGYDGNSSLTSVEVYSPTSRKWTSLPPMQTKRYYCAAVSMGGQIYIMGGKGRKSRLSSVEVYNPISGQWKSLPHMHTKRSGCAAVSLGEQIYIIGGSDGNSNLTSVEVYSPASRKWTSLPPMQTKRSHCAAVSIGGQPCVMGGYGGGSYLSSVEVFSVQHNSSEVCARQLSRTSLESVIPLQQQMTQQPCISIDESAGSQADQLPFPSQIPHTLQLLQSKIPTANFIPVATEVVPVVDSSVSQSAAAATTTTSLNQHLTNATTQEVCQWLARHGISKASLDILQHEDIDGIFLFEEPFDEIKSVLKEEGMSAGQISRIRHVIEKAKKEGSLL